METEFELSLGMQRWPLPSTAEEITLGRAANADVRLPADDQISRIHARLVRTGAAWTLHDASRNGTGLNGRRLTAPTPLTNNDQIHIGRSVLTFHATPAPAGAPPAPHSATPGTPGAAAAASTHSATPTPPPPASAPLPGGTPGTSVPPPSPAAEAPAAPTPVPPAGAPPVPGGASTPADPAGGAPTSPPAGAAPVPDRASSPGTPALPPDPAGGAPTTPTPYESGRPGATDSRPAAPGYEPPAAPDRRNEPADADSYQVRWQQASTGEDERYGGAESGSHPSDAGQLGAASTTPPPPAPSRPLTPRPAPTKPTSSPPTPAGPGSASTGPAAPGPSATGPAAAGSGTSGSGTSGSGTPGSGGSGSGASGSAPAVGRPARDAGDSAGSPFAPSGPPADAVPRNDPYPADRASISQPNPADASNSASWPGYPSADYLESARSPLSGGDRAHIDTPRNPYPERPDYPSYPDEPSASRPSPRPAARPANRPERRPRETTGEVGQVRLARVFAIAGAMLAVGLVINLIATFLADGPGGLLRWLIAPTLALLGAMTFAILDAVSPTEREPGRLDVSVIVAIGAVLLGVGVGGFAITSGAEYAAGYLSGNESGEDRLIKPVGKTTAGLTITVDNVTNTSHFTRIRLTVNNKGKDSVSLPLDGNATFTSAEGNSIRADDSRSNWPKQFAPGQSEQGTIVFKGHLPKGQKTAILTLRPGDTPVVVTGIPLSN